jgi:hypothetical protein
MLNSGCAVQIWIVVVVVMEMARSIIMIAWKQTKNAAVRTQKGVRHVLKASAHVNRRLAVLCVHRAHTIGWMASAKNVLKMLYFLSRVFVVH